MTGDDEETTATGRHGCTLRHQPCGFCKEHLPVLPPEAETRSCGIQSGRDPCNSRTSGICLLRSASLRKQPHRSFSTRQPSVRFQENGERGTRFGKRSSLSGDSQRDNADNERYRNQISGIARCQWELLFADCNVQQTKTQFSQTEKQDVGKTIPNVRPASESARKNSDRE